MNPLNPEDIQDLKQLIEFLRENQVAEFEFGRGDSKVMLKFEQHQPSAGLPDLTSLPAGARAASTQIESAKAGTAAGAEAAAELDAGLHVVKSPIVGTYYGSPSPGAPPFVSPGEHVDKGQVICIVEAMKLMNEIESDGDGEIVKCFCSNGQPIEFGQPLFSIRLG
jgi:acetyl-CoA carboxylase biotin carboxyl carrier protein